MTTKTRIGVIIAASVLAAGGLGAGIAVAVTGDQDGDSTSQTVTGGTADTDQGGADTDGD